MKINVIATGSAGNLYEIVDCNGNSILIEAGKPRSYYMAHKIGKVAPEMCIISHGHSDHAQYIKEFEAMMTVKFMMRQNTSANFKALGFEMKHGEGKSMSYIIKSLVEDKFVFFCTDAEAGDYPELFKELKRLNVENYLIECNYNDFLYHLADELQRTGCDRHLSDNDVVNFIRKIKPKTPKIITIHGSNRLSADTYTKNYIGSKIINSTVMVATGNKNGVKNLFNI